MKIQCVCVAWVATRKVANYSRGCKFIIREDGISKYWRLNEWFSERITDPIIWICDERTANNGLLKKGVNREVSPEFFAIGSAVDEGVRPLGLYIPTRIFARALKRGIN